MLSFAAIWSCLGDTSVSFSLSCEWDYLVLGCHKDEGAGSAFVSLVKKQSFTKGSRIFFFVQYEHLLSA